MDNTMDEGEQRYTEALDRIREILDERHDLYAHQPPLDSRKLQDELVRLREHERRCVALLEAVEAGADDERLSTLHHLAGWRLYDFS